VDPFGEYRGRPELEESDVPFEMRQKITGNVWRFAVGQCLILNQLLVPNMGH